MTHLQKTLDIVALGEDMAAARAGGDDLWATTADAHGAAPLSVQGFGAVDPFPKPDAVRQVLNVVTKGTAA